jgi:hypothetical protein
MQDALDTFHANKNVFIELRIQNHFNIPKLHSMLHYIESVYSLGSVDGFNSEHPERLHIDYAKSAYRASNRVDYYAQMTKWLQQQEAICCHAVYIEWVLDNDLGAQKKVNDNNLDAIADQDNTLIITKSAQVQAAFSVSGIIQGHAYCILKTCPYPRVSIGCL